MEYHPEYHPEYQPEYQPEYHPTAAVSPRLLQHCRVALQSVAMLHAVSMAVASTSGRPLSDMFPFAVEAETFRQVKDFFKIDTCDINSPTPDTGVPGVGGPSEGDSPAPPPRQLRGPGHLAPPQPRPRDTRALLETGRGESKAHR